MHYGFENDASWKFGSLIVDPKYGAVIFRTGAEDTPMENNIRRAVPSRFFEEGNQRLPAKYYNLLTGSKMCYPVENENLLFEWQNCLW